MYYLKVVMCRINVQYPDLHACDDLGKDQLLLSSRKHGDVCREKGNRKKAWKERIGAALNHTEFELIT